MIGTAWCHLARWLVRCSPHGRFLLTEYAWRLARRISASDSMRVELFDHAYYLQPLQYRTEFYLYCLRHEFLSRNDAALTTRMVRPGETVIDLGANIGNFAVPMAHAVGPTGRVIAVEPCLQVFRRLVHHIAMNPGGCIVPLRLAIGEQNGDEVFL